MPSSTASGPSLRRLQFVPAQRQDAHGVSPADLERLIKLNPEPPQAPEPADSAMARSGDRSAGRQPAQRRELFKSEDLSLQWREIRKAGTGLQNLGNTCFMNSVLQSLVHTPPLAELLLSQSAARLHNGAVNGFYPIQLARELVARSLAQHSRGPHAPMAFAKSLRRISRSFRPGRQEDAHEFLIALLDAMHEASIAHMQPKPPPEVAHTSFIYRIFGGRMRSQVKCSECGYESNTYDPCIDLSLEITKAKTVQRALERFTAGEALDGANKYKCPKQQKAVRAIKRMSVDAAPNVLMIQLKRFEFSFSGHKISKKVDFDLELDLGPYMSERPRHPALYDLYAVLVHSGHSVHSGHYYAYVRAPNGIWHICDDTHVAQVAERQVMAQKAYILFYIKRQPSGKRPPSIAQPPSAAPSPAAAVASHAPAPSTAAAVPAPQRRQDVQQPPAAVGKEQAAEAAALLAGASVARPPGSRKAAKVAAAVATPATNGISKKRRREVEAAAAAAVAAAAAEAGGVGSGEYDAPPSAKRHHLLQQNGRISKKSRLRAMHGMDEEPHAASPMRTLRQFGAIVSPLVMLNRRGARLAEAVSISRNSMRLLSRRKAKAAAAAAAAASPGLAAVAAAGQADSGGSSDGAAGGSATTSVVSAPDWPPMRQQPAGASQLQEQALPKPKRRRPRPPEEEEQQQQRAPLSSQAQQREQQTQPAPAAQQAGPSSTGRSISEADVRAFLRKSGGGTKLPLSPWEDADAATKRQQAQLLRQEAPKRKRLDEYDLEYDKGRTKKVKSKRHSGEEGGGEEGGGLQGADFDAAWQQKQHSGVKTELRGNRKRRSQDFKRQQQQQHGRHHSGGRVRPPFGGGGRRHGRGRQ